MTTTTNVPALDNTVHTTNEWIGALAESLSTDHETAYGALRGTLHTLRDAIGIDEAAHLAAQLPMLLRGVFYTGWDPTSSPVRFDERTFLDGIRRQGGLGDTGPHPLAAARATVHLLRERISPGEVDDVVDRLGDEIATMLEPGSS
jgi:uncharacterized protein (DUF2267 family)